MTPLPDTLLDAVAAEAVCEGLADALFAPVETPLGTLTLAVGERGIVRLAYPEFADGALAAVAGALGPRVLRAPRELRDTSAAIVAYVEGDLPGDLELPVDLALASTPFRRRVLETLHDTVRRGQTIGYGALAALAGRPGAARAVGSTMAHNPVPIVVPCHRVLPSTGALGTYTGGAERKLALLGVEGVTPPS